jgi:hypothetical protein
LRAIEAGFKKIFGMIFLMVATYHLNLLIKSLSMATNLTLDDLILQFSENPFIEEEMFAIPKFSDKGEKQKILGRLLAIASNLFSQNSITELSSYKRRYEFK